MMLRLLDLRVGTGGPCCRKQLTGCIGVTSSTGLGAGAVVLSHSSEAQCGPGV